MKIKNKKSIIVLSVLATLLLLGGAYAYSRNSSEESATPATTTEQQSPYAPPTEEEKNSGDNAKKKFDNTPSSTNTSGQKSVKPEITYKGVYGGNVEVSSHVPGIFEKSGKCTLTLKKDNETVSQSKTAVPNVSEMSCGLIKITTSKLSDGKWSATVAYSSVKAKGISDAVSIEVK